MSLPILDGELASNLREVCSWCGLQITADFFRELNHVLFSQEDAFFLVRLT